MPQHELLACAQCGCFAFSCFEDFAIRVKGIAWTTGYRVFAMLAQFGAMLVLVRIIPPEEYGRAGAVVGVLTMLNVLSCRAFVSQALQLPEGEEPDWTMHWRAGFWLQATLFVVTNAIAGGLWFLPSHRSIAILLHLASLGAVFECPSALRSTMLQRALDFPRLRILDGISKAFSILTMLSLGVAGFGALAIVAGANVVPAIPGYQTIRSAILWVRTRPLTRSVYYYLQENYLAPDRRKGFWEKIQAPPDASDLSSEQAQQMARLRAVGYLSGYEASPEKKGVTAYDRERAYDGLSPLHLRGFREGRSHRHGRNGAARMAATVSSGLSRLPRATRCLLSRILAPRLHVPQRPICSRSSTVLVSSSSTGIRI